LTCGEGIIKIIFLEVELMKVKLIEVYHVAESRMCEVSRHVAAPTFTIIVTP
jgi:hypothetical protein